MDCKLIQVFFVKLTEVSDILSGMASKFGISFFPWEKIEAKFWCHPAEQNLRRFDEIFRENTVFCIIIMLLLRYFDEIFAM